MSSESSQITPGDLPRSPGVDADRAPTAAGQGCEIFADRPMLPQISSKPWLWRGRIPSLDGLRAISILAVIIHHFALVYPDAFPGPLQTIAINGNIGVDIFFVISGFLITLLMLRERNVSGAISLKGFYLRRVFRIVPAYLAYCFGVFLINSFAAAPFPSSAWVAPLTYMTDFYIKKTPWSLGHTWTLSVEEHFYLVWPLVMCFAPRKAVLAALACVVSAPVIRYAVGYVPLPWTYAEYFTFTRWDAIAMGCFLAFAMTRGWTNRPTLLAGRCPLLLALIAIAIIAVNMQFIATLTPGRWGSRYDHILYHTVNDLCLTLLVWLTLEHPHGRVGWLLNTRPFIVVGSLSYSLYLWQQLFIDPTHLSWYSRWPVNVVLVMMAAGVSYVLVERPFLSLRARLERKHLGEAPVESAVAVG
ncbi:MAG: acyltransferase [Planctomycetota bacterium]|nr:acyltransferase [Planctomycetota bacterium]